MIPTPNITHGDLTPQHHSANRWLTLCDPQLSAQPQCYDGYFLLPSLKQNSAVIAKETLRRLNSVGTLMHKLFPDDEEISGFFFNGEFDAQPEVEICF